MENIKKYAVGSLVVLMIYSIIFFVRNSNIPDVQIDHQGNTVGPITVNNTVEQTFVPHNDGLSNIEVVLATYGRVNDCTVSFEVTDNDGNIIVSKKEAASNIKDNSGFSLDFAPIADSRGKTYKIKISSDSQSDDNAITAWASINDLYSDGELSLDGTVMPYDIALVTSISSRINSAGLFLFGFGCILCSVIIFLTAHIIRKPHNAVLWSVCSCFAASGLTVLYDRIVLDHFALQEEFSASFILKAVLFLIPVLIILFFDNDKLIRVLSSHEFCFVCLIFCFGVLFHFLLANIDSRFISIYPDEYYYYDIARNIANGNGIIPSHFRADFDKIAYPIIISPFFLIKDIPVRLSVMAFVNSVIAMSSIFPLYLICKEIKLNKGNTFAFLIIMSFWSDLLCSMTFMSEILYWPIALLSIYLWIANSKKPKIRLAVINGVLCYIGYMCKNVFLAIVIANIVWEVLYPVICRIIAEKNKREGLWHYFDKQRLINCLTFIITFVVCNIAGQFMMGLTSSSENVNSVISGMDLYSAVYLIYAALYYLFAMLLSVFIIPFAFPAISFKALNEPVKKLYSYIITVILILIAIVSYTISIRETLGAVQLRILYRYFSPIITVVIICFLYALQTDYDSSKSSGAVSWTIITLSSWLPCLVYTGTFKGSQSDSSLLNWYEALEKNIGVLSISENTYDFKLYQLFIGFILITLVFVCFYLFTRNNKRAVKIIYLTVFAAASTFNNFTEYKENNAGNKDFANNVILIDNYLNSLPEKPNVLYLSSDRAGVLQLVYDTYTSDQKSVYIASYADFFNKDGSTYQYDVTDPEFYNLIEGTDSSNISGIDYIIADYYAERYKKQIDNVEKIDVGYDEHYVLYRNIDNKSIIIKDRTE